MSLKPSDLSSKVTVPAGLTPANDNSEYPTHYSTFGHGGLRTVNTIAERDALPSDRRVNGMLAFVVADSKYYQLQSDLTTWVEFNSGSSSGSAGQLTAIIVNNSGATLTSGRAYSLQDDVFDQSTNTVTFTATFPGTVTAGQTGLIWIETEILNGATGSGVLYGIIDFGTVAPFVVDTDFSIFANGGANTLPLDGEFIIGTVLRSPAATTQIEILFDGMSIYRLRREGRLECNVTNNTGVTLAADRAYSLENDVYNAVLNTVSFNAVLNGAVTAGQTGLVWLETAIADGTTGKGVIKGIVGSGTNEAVAAEIDFSIQANGFPTSIVSVGQYVIATALISPNSGTEVEYAFDGLSNYKFVVNTDTNTITEIENNGTRIGDDTLTKINFSTNLTATIDPMDSTTVNVVGSASSGGGAGSGADIDMGRRTTGAANMNLGRRV